MTEYLDAFFYHEFLHVLKCFLQTFTTLPIILIFAWQLDTVAGIPPKALYADKNSF